MFAPIPHFENDVDMDKLPQGHPPFTAGVHIN